ncbi:hornerin isoform X3 [Selaginella moellendorffii]|uniref:hornerin isoform X3 n=1 Tax=Selaginella moellendorffii TaxID=88036 RepID=UPI000D1C48EE|nr:hornerin isoform X3 [Selaginella moellendorffii]|eukprot:XP_002969146.2 hornerin isoform X3 [Selaginella moellendorffii]
MSYEQQIRDQSGMDQQENSPYVAHSDAVGHLGQPSSERPSQAPGDRGVHFGKNAGYGDTEAVNPQSGQQQHHHPLEATHDTNIGHGHEPFSASTTESGYVAPAGADQRHRGMGEKMKDAVKGAVGGGPKSSSHDQVHGVPAGQGPGGAHDQLHGVPAGQGTGVPPEQQSKSPGFVGKMKDALTGQKPGYGAATGHATTGGAVPGEEDYAGKFQGEHDTKWPRPVPPPGMSKASVTSDRPGETHFASNRPDAGTPESYSTGPGPYGEEKASRYQNVGKPGHEGTTYNPEQQHYGGQNVAEPGTGGLMGTTYNGGEKTGPGTGTEYGAGDHATGTAYGAGDPNYQKSAAGTGTEYGAGDPNYQKSGAGTGTEYGAGDHATGTAYGAGDPNYQKSAAGTGTEYGAGDHATGTAYGAGDPNYQKSAAGTHDPSKAVQEEMYPPESYKGAEQYSTPGAASTPAPPNARHDTPTGQNEGGGEYKDSHGVHKEGPRDDNVKKEGLMAKMMDKLHLSPKHRDRAQHKDSTTTTTS